LTGSSAQLDRCRGDELLRLLILAVLAKADQLMSAEELAGRISAMVS